MRVCVCVDLYIPIYMPIIVVHVSLASIACEPRVNESEGAPPPLYLPALSYAFSWHLWRTAGRRRISLHFSW